MQEEGPNLCQLVYIEMLDFTGITRVRSGAYHFCVIDQGVGGGRFLALLLRLICPFLRTPKLLLGGLFLSEPMCIDGLLIIRAGVFLILKKVTWAMQIH